MVEPYATFLAYEITDATAAQALLPQGYELLPASMFADEAPRLTCILGVFGVHTSVFWGVRLEVSLLARNLSTSLLTWVICEVESNTISHEPGRGFAGPSADHAMLTTTYAGEVLIDVVGNDGRNRLQGSLDLDAATMGGLAERTWVEGNLSVDYGADLGKPGTEQFGLIFDPAEVAQALRVPLDALSLTANTVAAEFRAAAPYSAAVFPYAQHYLTSSFPITGTATDRESLTARFLEAADR